MNENMNKEVNEDIEKNATENQGQDVNQEEKSENKDVKSFTQEELDSIIKSNVDRALAKANKEAEEAKKLAKMNAEQKAKYELEQAEKKLAEREAEVTRRELTAEAKSILSERGLSTDLHSLLNYESAETVQANIDALEKAIQQSTEKAVEERLKGSTPKSSTGTARITKNEILNISNPLERQKKIAENIDLFE